MAMQIGRILVSLMLLSLCAACNDGSGRAAEPVSAGIRDIFAKPIYRNATWALRVVDIDSGAIIHDEQGERALLIGSVRKLFSMAVALDAFGPDRSFRTPVHRRGSVDAGGTLTGDLILVASGDPSMGGRTRPDGSFDLSDFDHNEANALGSAILTAADPLAGYDALARQVAAAGIRRVTGEVIIDDRLFQPFNFRGEFDIRPIFVNDDTVDVILRPGQGGAAPQLDWRPKSAAFAVIDNAIAAAPGAGATILLEPELPACIGIALCSGAVNGALAPDFVPPLNGQLPLVRTFRIVQPANYARTVFIEALARAGVIVAAPAVAPNPASALPTERNYPEATRIAELVSHPLRDHARHILKVSYNIGADLFTMLYGVSQGQTSFAGALAAELRRLTEGFGIPAQDMQFVDGSGGGETRATGSAVIRLLQAMRGNAAFADFKASLPRLGQDGSLASINAFAADPALAGARGQVRAKTGTYVSASPPGPVLRAQALAGYITAKSGKHLAFHLVVNDVGVIRDIADIITVFEDQGTISARLWAEH
jgi:D-alanyl-D-alanine carboxypeptidase/D-alanyl-D-alanine-endopeptidase (penicillin-binding protein 4)